MPAWSYSIGIPLFDSCTLHLPSGRDFTVTADRRRADSTRVRRITRDGRPHKGLEGQRIFPVGGCGCQEYSFASLNMKNLMSPTPRNWVLNALILALKDSADALVSRRSK